MLFQSPDAAGALRMQGVFVSDTEIQRIVRYWKGARGVDSAEAALPGAPAPMEAMPSSNATQSHRAGSSSRRPPRRASRRCGMRRPSPTWRRAPTAKTSC